MSERELIIRCIPQMTEMVMAIKDMSAEEYGEFKRVQIEDTGRTCPQALGFIKKMFRVIEYTLAMEYLEESDRKEEEKCLISGLLPARMGQTL
ncbi:hypothetical protein D7V86_25965 [bacterium D16-51]|nr:hypothetical protein D7V96_26480 [bacterium D16-59]RKI52337.1 hypothetical protein D7V86_25965 [bacterium D16-51]